MDFVDIAFRLVHPYAFWIGECAREQRIDKLFFLSRDGSLPLTMYDHLAEKGIVPDITREYLYVSRHSLQVAAGELNVKTHENLTKQSKEYLESRISNYRRIGIVDVGCNGSAVKLFSSMFPTIEFFGFYFGSHNSSNSQVNSFLGNIGLSRFFGFTELVETLMSSPDPSVKFIYKNDNKVIRDYFRQNKFVRNFQEELHANFKKKLGTYEYREPQILDSQSVYKLLVELTFFPNIENVKKLMSYQHSHSGDQNIGSSLISLETKISSKKIYLPFWSLQAIVNSKIKISQKIMKTAILGVNFFIYIIKKTARNPIDRNFYLGRLRR